MLQAQIYPTPNQSPFFKTSTILPKSVWELTTAPVYVQTPTLPLRDLNNISNVSNSNKTKRKNLVPQRSISQPKDQVDRSYQKIVTLDVYAAFKENPSLLLSRRPSFAESEVSTKSCSLGTDLKSKGSVAAVQSAAKVLPNFIVQKEPESFDLSAYQLTKGAPSVSWKGAQPLAITPEMPEYDTLTTEEIKTCGILRILPTQYLEIKRTMLTAVCSYGPFKKREAQTWFRIDVNKICIIYDWFKSLGWIPNTEEWLAVDQKRPSGSDGARAKKVKRK